MTQRRHTEEQIRSKLAAVHKRLQDGEALEHAIDKEGIPRSTYFRWKKSHGAALLPAVNKDWYALARTWNCDLSRKFDIGSGRAVEDVVAEAFSMIYGTPAAPRLTVEIDQLHGLLKALEPLTETFAALDPPARGTLEELLDPGGRGASMAYLVERLLALIPELEEYVEALEQHALELGDTAGGPDRDPRTERIVAALAVIFAKFSGSQPTYVTDSDDGRPISSFAHFVSDALRHFGPELNIPKTAIREATRHAAARVNWRHAVNNKN